MELTATIKFYVPWNVPCSVLQKRATKCAMVSIKQEKQTQHNSNKERNGVNQARKTNTTYEHASCCRMGLSLKLFTERKHGKSTLCDRTRS
jgi:hypothetical protein